MKTALYARVSSQDQSLESQLQECRQWCASQKITPEEYLDKASGATTSRDGLDKLMADIRRGRIATVICYKLDRLGRSLVHLAQMVGEFESNGVALVCPSQGIDTRQSNPAGRLQMHVLMAVAEFERSIIRDRTKAGMAAAKARGAAVGRPKGSKLKINVAELRDHLAQEGSIYSFARSSGHSETSLRRALKAA